MKSKELIEQLKSLVLEYEKELERKNRLIETLKTKAACAETNAHTIPVVAVYPKIEQLQ